MNYCKECGVEIIPSEFDFYFSKEALNDSLCKKCLQVKLEKERKIAEEEVVKHPDWYGPTKELF